MRFSIATIFVALAGLVAGRSVAPRAPANQVIESLASLTNTSQSLTDPVNLLGASNANDLILGSGSGAEVLTGLTSLIAQATASVPILSTARLFTGNDSVGIGSEFHGLVTVVEGVLSTLVDKADDLLAKVPLVGPPLAAVLLTLETVLDTLAGVLESIVSGITADGIKNDVNSLNAALASAISAYSL